MIGPALVPALTAHGCGGAVVSPHGLATQAGIATLRRGGTAVDAAIATNAALAVVTSQSCGLGGDAFWLIWPGATDGLRALNGSGRSGAGATLEAARAAGLTRMPLRGPWTVTVPGAVRSWGDAHERYGHLPWADLFEPAIELAGGFPATRGWIGAVERHATIFGTASDWASTFRPHGRAWRPGERVTLPALRHTLELIAREGPAVAYEGDLARRSATYLESRGSPLRAADLADHRSTWAEPISVRYRGVESASHPPNSSGPLALELLNVLGCLEPPPDTIDAAGPVDPGWVHVGLEAARLVLADRDAYLTDPEAMARGALELLLSPEHARELAGRIDPGHAQAPLPLATPAGGGTVFLGVVDRGGRAVSLLQSNFSGFGSGLVDPETGIGFQNRGGFFVLDPRHANALAPRKRTMHTLTPGMLLRDGRPWIVHGSMGGEIQPQVFAQFVSAVVDGGRSIADAVAAPRFAADADRHYAPPSVTRLEGGLPPALGDALSAMGHVVTWTPPLSSKLGHEHAIELIFEDTLPEPISFVATADPRSEGLPGAL